MKKIRLILFLSMCILSSAHAQDMAQDISAIKQEVASLQTQNGRLMKEVAELTRQNKKASSCISELQAKTKNMDLLLDSLQKQLVTISYTQKTDNETLTTKLGETNQDVKNNQLMLSSRTTWGIVSILLLLVTICIVVWLFLKKFQAGTISIDEVRKAQDALRDAQKKMQEESIKLDSQLLSILETKPLQVNTDAEPDHSLAKKVADEIVRIELNLSRMDSSIKGHKQLAKAVQRIKDNFNANGYEIVDMLGKPYNEGMKVVANFVADENLPEGSQIITGITKPQINYNGQMIQSAQITVNQNI